MNVIMNQPEFHPDYPNLTDEEIATWWQTDHKEQISAVSLSEQRQVWIGQECFPATELWSDDNGYILIESPAGDVYGIETINIQWVNQEDY